MTAKQTVILREPSLLYWRTTLFLVLISVYGLMFYLILKYQYRLDFTSFYFACRTLMEGGNPYQVLVASSLPTVQTLSANLNPPVTLWLMMPLAWFSYDTAMIIWAAVSGILGLIGAHLAFQYAFPLGFLKKNRLVLYALYLLSFGVLINAIIGQMGAILGFLTMSGYYFYRKDNAYLAGLCWGGMIALKLFPALLFFYVFFQKRYRVLGSMLCVASLLWAIPLWGYGVSIYSQYFSMLSRVLWYGDSWNASLYGFMARLFIDTSDNTQSLLLIESLYLVVFSIGLIWFGWKLKQEESSARDGPKDSSSHATFALTLVVMVFLSPLGWLYYFPVLTLPLCLTWKSAMLGEGQTNQTVWIWFTSFFLLNFPMDYIKSGQMATWMGKIGIFSFHFYGLLLLVYLTSRLRDTPDGPRHAITLPYQSHPFFSILYAWIVLVFSISFATHLLSIR